MEPRAQQKDRLPVLAEQRQSSEARALSRTLERQGVEEGTTQASIQVRSSTASPVPTPEEMLLAGTNSQTCLKGQRLSSRLLLKQTQGMGAQVGGGGSQPELSWNQTRKPCFPGGPRVPEITLSLQCDNGRSLHRKVAGSKGQSLHPSRLLVPKES